MIKNKNGDFIFIAFTVIIYGVGVLLISIFSHGIFE